MALQSKYDGNYYTPTSQDPTGFAPFLGTDPRTFGYSTWQQAANAINERFGPSAIGYAGQHGYFDNYFPDTYAAQDGPNVLGQAIASGQAARDAETGIGAKLGDAGPLGKLLLGGIGMAGGLTGAAALTGNIQDKGDLANYAAGDAAGLAAGAGLAGWTGAAEGTGVYGGLDSTAIAGADFGAESAPTGGGMFDWIDEMFSSGSDMGAENMFGFESGATDFGAENMFGYDAAGAAELASMVSQSVPQWLRNLGPAAANLLKSFGSSTGRNMLNQFTDDPLGSAFNMTPFILALAEGNKQKNDIRDITNQVQDLVGEVSTAPIQDMVLRPYDRETELGKGNLLTSLGNRGVMGSSFANEDILNYDTRRGEGRADIATKALLGSVGTRGALLDQVLRGTNQMNTNKNLLLGSGLNASARLFDRPADPFGIENILKRMNG